MKNRWIIIGALTGALVVALGAFGAHALKGRLDAYGEAIYAKAVLYQMLHTVAILIVGILKQFKSELNIDVAGWAFLTGILLFSGSLYLLAMTGMKGLGMITPFGGVSFIVGWLWLAHAAWRMQR